MVGATENHPEKGNQKKEKKKKVSKKKRRQSSSSVNFRFRTKFPVLVIFCRIKLEMLTTGFKCHGNGDQAIDSTGANMLTVDFLDTLMLISSDVII